MNSNHQISYYGWTLDFQNKYTGCLLFNEEKNYLYFYQPVVNRVEPFSLCRLKKLVVIRSHIFKPG